MTKIMNQAFYLKDTNTAAKALLGKKLTHIVDGKSLSGMIVETEAYIGPYDRAAHSFGGRRTKRTEAMYAIGGVAYVFMLYGMHCCLCAVTGGAEKPEAILIRALEPIDGIETMKQNRAQDKLANLTNGPGKLCQALNIDMRHYGASLISSTLFISEYKKIPASQIASSPRVNIDYAGEAAAYPWRYYVKENPFVSK